MSTFTSKDEVDRSYDTVHATFRTGKTKSLKWRKWQIKQLWWLVADNEAAIIAAAKQDLNRPEFETRLLEIIVLKNEIQELLANIDKWTAPHTPEDAGFVWGTLARAKLRREPYGVALIIGAWNFPILTILSPLFGAIAAGNCVILKPSESAPASQKLMEELVPKYLDNNAIRLVTGGAAETGYVLEHKSNVIFYTGGAVVARTISAAAAKHLTPVVLELGGQCPAIVTASANVDLAAKKIIATKLVNSGQICLNVNHVLAHPAIYDQLLASMEQWLNKFLQGNTSELASIINERHFNRVKTLLENTKGKVVYGGIDKARPDEKFACPTIVRDVSRSDSLLSEELFAPFLPVVKADTKAALDFVNSLPHPLGLYIFTEKQSDVDHIVNNTNSGGVTVNECMLHAGVAGAPFGGVGESGSGSYHGKWGIEAFSHRRTVASATKVFDALMGLRFRPYNINLLKWAEPGKPGFKTGETMADQSEGPGGSLVGTTVKIGSALLVSYVAIEAVRTGQAPGFVRNYIK